MKKLTLGILGLGEGRSIISAALESDMWSVGSVCDLNEALCQKRIKEFGLSDYTLDYEDMLKDSKIDVIGIYTPDQLHSKHILMALEAGKHVICTKPLMTSLKDAKLLLDAQKRNGKIVFVGQSSRYFEPFRRQRKDYISGKHGELVAVETQYITDGRWFLEKAWTKSKGFTWMYGFMIHAVDLAAWYLPEIESVYGAGYISDNTKAYGLNIPDSMTFIFKNKDGKTATVKGNYTAPTLGSHVEQPISCALTGTKGISKAGYPLLKYYHNFDSSSKETVLEEYNDLYDYYFRFEKQSHHAGEYQNYLEDFYTKVINGDKPKPDLEEGIRTLAIMEAMEISMENGEVVAVNDILSKWNL